MVNMISDWPAVKEWSPDYFKRKHGQAEIEIIHHDPNSETHLESFLKNETQEITLADYVESLSSLERAYALREEYEVFEMLPGLIDDVNHFAPFSTKESCMAEGFYKALWFGPKGYETGMHADFGHLSLFHIYGRKRILFFAPDQTEFLYEETVETSELYESMREDVATFYSDQVRWAKVNALKPDFEKYPLLEQAHYYEGHLEPGQVLYVPHLWWHTVESKDISISISADLDESNFLKFLPGQN
jgi:lysine-specific demethylase 8